MNKDALQIRVNSDSRDGLTFDRAGILIGGEWLVWEPMNHTLDSGNVWSSIEDLVMGRESTASTIWIGLTRGVNDVSANICEL